jgi:hypothetical protein
MDNVQKCDSYINIPVDHRGGRVYHYTPYITFRSNLKNFLRYPLLMRVYIFGPLIFLAPSVYGNY